MKFRFDCTVKVDTSAMPGTYDAVSVRGYVDYGRLDLLPNDPWFRIIRISQEDYDALRKKRLERLAANEISSKTPVHDPLFVVSSPAAQQKKE